MPGTRRFLFRFLLMSIVALSAGCGSGTSTVEGTITFHGKPVKSGSVILYCADKQIVRGLIVDGQYSIPNVPRGPATVTVQAHNRVPQGLRLSQQLPPSNDGPVGFPWSSKDVGEIALPPRYSHPEESGLTIEVDNATVTFGIDLKP